MGGTLIEATSTRPGGGAARYFTYFESGMRRELTQAPAYCPPATIVASQLGATAGAMGAAVIAERSIAS